MSAAERSLSFESAPYSSAVDRLKTDLCNLHFVVVRVQHFFFFFFFFFKRKKKKFERGFVRVACHFCADVKNYGSLRLRKLVVLI
jgi:hypothetical protein